MSKHEINLKKNAPPSKAEFTGIQNLVFKFNDQEKESMADKKKALQEKKIQNEEKVF